VKLWLQGGKVSNHHQYWVCCDYTAGAGVAVELGP